MKKLILLLFFASMAVIGSSQGLLKRIPGDLFTSNEYGLKAAGSTVAWIPRLNTGVVAVSFGKNYGPVDLNALGFGIGLLRYKDDEGTPFNDIGVNLLYLKNLKDNGSGVGIFFTYNINDAVGLLNVGTHYDFLIKQFLIDTGVTFHF